MTTASEAVNPRLKALTDAGVSVWLDQIRRSLVEQGEFARMVAEDSVRGVTSNPSIFEKAILGSNDYDEELDQAARENLEAQA
ncbi:MAG TPA: transaldolase family protein, partial [Solirubrobacteraceae bacterium]|nr:transaldolase family protein [Solirubrobacteraceae bacterium]